MHNLPTTRRGFLRSSLGFSILAAGGVNILSEAAMAQARTASELGAWIVISCDDRVTIRFASAEMGQGVNTSLPMIVAEELDVDWAQVQVEQVDADPDRSLGNPEFGGNLFTAGSASIGGYFDILRRAGAAARLILIQSVAEAWAVPVTEVTTEAGVVFHGASGRQTSYGAAATTLELVTDVPELTEADLKPRSDWRIIGQNLDRLDIPGKTRGEGIYSIDVRLPNMLYATQILPPVEGETPIRFDDAKVHELAGVVDVVDLGSSIAILAGTWEAALAARDLLDVTWSETSPFRNADSATEIEELRAAAADYTRIATIWEDRGDALAAIQDGQNLISAELTTEHVYHAQLEPLNAVAAVDEDGKGAEVWLGTQSQSVTIGIAAGVLQTTPDRIRLHATQMGGAFGRRTVFARDLLRDALILSRRAKRPVKLMWTREDDVKQGWFRPPTAHRLEAVLEADGSIAAMRHRLAAPSIMEFAFPQRWDSDARLDPLLIEGMESQDYDIPNFRAEHIVTPRHARMAAWRGIGWGPNLFAREAFLDIIAAETRQSPLDLRRRLLRNSPRGQAVLERAAEMSGFGEPPSGRAHGIAFAGYKETYGAGVAEVSLEDGSLRVHRFWAAVDPGIVVHPINYVAQVEGAVQYALSSVLRERITFSGGEIDQNNFYDYELLRIGEAANVEVALIESGATPSGGGEIGVPMTGGAIANAVRALTGTTPTNLPLQTT
ncbi:xanthine dehydrogenase family protein molybdopterin-binding subunit [Rhodobacteraceae bacterium NNCM2]|nr:xanthine dehydrogenase family protein molybdopterin-binding subunit [Coraliihabitans acroporae]